MLIRIIVLVAVAPLIGVAVVMIGWLWPIFLAGVFCFYIVKKEVLHL
jgi:hypothetical protein